MNREQFLLDRKKGLGGSDIPAILGVSDWSTPLEVYRDKMNPELIEQELSEDLERGIRVEDYILHTYSDKCEVELDKNIPTIVDKAYPFMRANIDAMVRGQNIVVEAKSTKAPTSTWEKGIPEYYKPQVAYYAMLTDADYVEVPVMFSCWNYACYTYWRDESYEAMIKDKVIDFWNNHIVKGVPPEPTNLDELKASYPTLDKTKTIKADNTISAKVSMLQEVTEQRKILEKQEKQLKVQIQGFMGDASFLDAGFCRLSLKEYTASKFDVSAFKEASPELYKQYLSESSYRKLQFIGG